MELLTRRDALALSAAGLAALAAPGFIGRARADSDDERLGMSAFGDLKYPPDVRHFDYVDPNAPKGGVFSQVGSTRQYNQNFLTF
ncbi:MAG: ABC transporter substrate-binding protein, partial [Rhodoplanes sp.]